VGEGRGGFALFAGRLSPEKGVETLLAAWQRHLAGPIRLKIAGTGPLSSQVAEAARVLPCVEWLGEQPNHEVISLMKDAQVLIFPSIWYESMPMVIAEAHAAGLPVIASELGAMSSLIDPGRTGLHFPPGDAQALARQVEWAFGHPEEVARMRGEARQAFERTYSAEGNCGRLVKIYDLAIERRKASAESRAR
jgi:glycosyltransferase involved in cell wall biosynthesis